MFKKDDNLKPMMALIEPAFIEGLADVLTFGAEKYGVDNWKSANGDDDIRRIQSALMRHIVKYFAGEEFDKETGLSHAYHAAANLMFLDYHQRVKNDSLDS